MRDDADLTTDAGDQPSRAAGERIRHLDLDLLSLHVDGALDPGERRSAEVHLASCAACSLDYTELRVTVTLLQGLPQYEPRRSFALGPEYGKIRRRPLPPSRQVPAPSVPSSPWAPPAAPVPAAAAASPWFARVLPGTRTLTLATGAVAVALFAAIAGDALVADPPVSPALGLRTGQVATSILQPTGAQAPADVAAPAAPAAETAPADPALQQENGAPAAVAASSRPSPWRIAQIGLAMLLLWLLVSLGGRLWVDRHEALPG
ncbi:MAG: anti-sigma factor family protein [Chloroflexota bacterium]